MGGQASLLGCAGRRLDFDGSGNASVRLASWDVRRSHIHEFAAFSSYVGKGFAGYAVKGYGDDAEDAMRLNAGRVGHFSRGFFPNGARRAEVESLAAFQRTKLTPRARRSWPSMPEAACDDRGMDRAILLTLMAAYIGYSWSLTIRGIQAKRRGDFDLAGQLAGRRIAMMTGIPVGVVLVMVLIYVVPW